MAAETFAYNLLNEDLREEHSAAKSKVSWLTSNFARIDINKRLREDPRTTPAFSYLKSDLNQTTPLDGHLLVGSIVTLNNALESNEHFLQEIKKISNDLDLVSGGPPCQSFSMAGLRDAKNERNTLPLEFVRFVSTVKPKFALLENVSGILRAFNIEGKKFFAWVEVAKAFCDINYIPLCLHINAKFVGAPQNRPRYIMIGIREDLLQPLLATQNRIEQEILNSCRKFFDNHRQQDTNENSPHPPLFDLNKPDQQKYFKRTFLSELATSTEKFTSVESAIDDLRNYELDESEYVRLINSAFAPNHSTNTNKRINNEHRSVSPKVRSRFRIYQNLSKLSPQAHKDLKKLLKGEDILLTPATYQEAVSKSYLDLEGNETTFNSVETLANFLRLFKTKKQTQRALIADQPAPAALSIPDDACHYHNQEARTLTVREMARIQSFPDSFAFRSKITTGGKQRRFEVPQYTQVGNAVPPLLGKSLAKVIKNLQSRLAPQ